MSVNLIDEYLNNNNWRITENSNTSYSFSGLKFYIDGHILADYALDNLPEEIRSAHKKGYFHIHNLESGNLIRYCSGNSLQSLLMKGLWTPSIISRPAKHLNTAVDHVMNYLYMMQMECYDENTRVLTSNGWKFFKDVEIETDLIYTINVKTKEIELQKASEKIVKDPKERMMIHLKNKVIDVLVTRTHSMVVEKGNQLGFEKAEYLRSNQKIPRAGKWIGHEAEWKEFEPVIYGFNDSCRTETKIPMNLFVGLIGIYLAEGWYEQNPTDHHYRIGISQCNDEKIPIIRRLLEEIGIPFHYSGHDFYLHNKRLWEYFSKLGRSKVKFIPEEIKLLPSLKIDFMLDWFCLGDGSRNIKGNRIFYTSSKRLAEDLLECLLKVGSTGRIKERIITSSKQYLKGIPIGTSCLIYEVFENKRNLKVWVKKQNILEEKYTGSVYCLTVPNHTLLVMRNGIPCFCGNTAGAVAFNDVDTLLAPFIRYDKLSYKEVKQNIQRLVFNLNFTLRSSSQTPFSNFSFNLCVPKYLKDTPAIIGGMVCKEVYGDFQPEIDMFNIAFAEVLMDRDAMSRPFTFPIPTINLTKAVDWDSEAMRMILIEDMLLGSYYFMNYLGSGISEETVRAMCCRLNIDLSELSSAGGLWNMGDATGCYDDKTEILTKEGWKLFKDLTGKESVLTVNMNTEELEWQEILTQFSYKIEGKMVRIKNKSLDFLVTNNHRMIIKTDPRGDLQERRADSINSKCLIPSEFKWKGSLNSEIRIPSVERWNGKISEVMMVPSDLFSAFMGIWIAEGSFDNEKNALSHGYRVVISQTTVDKKRKIKELLEKFPFKFHEDVNGFTICNKQLWNYVKQFGHAHDKFIPNEIKESNVKNISTFLDWFFLGDGNFDGMNRRWFNTVSKRLADDIQECLIKIGKKSRIFFRVRKDANIKGRRIHSTGCYEISESISKAYYCIKPEFEDYNGIVYCVEVPNNTLIVRRNGIPIVCGNSLGVVTLNLPRIGYLSKSEDEILEKISALMNLAKQELLLKEEMIRKAYNIGLTPFSKFYDLNLNHYFRTIGVLGLNELCLNFTGKGLLHNASLGKKIIQFMRNKTKEYQKETGKLFNLEMTPAEGSSYRLARKDVEMYNDNIKTLGTKEAPYYTSLLIPPSDEMDVFERLKIEENILPLFTGGTIFRVFIGDELDDERVVSKFLQKIASTKVPYFDLTRTFAICPVEGKFFNGNIEICPSCGKTTELYSRVVGYYRSVNRWNPGKQAEFKARKYIDIKEQET